MSEFTAEKWQNSLGEFWHFLPAGVQDDLTERPAPKNWLVPKSNIFFLQLVKYLKQRDFDAVFHSICNVDMPTDYLDYLGIFGAYAAAQQENFDLAKSFLLEARGIDSTAVQSIHKAIAGRKSNEPQDSLGSDKGSCLKQEEQELLSIRFQDSTNTSLDSIEHNGSRSLLKKRVSEFSSATTQVSYPSEANAASFVTLFCAVYHRDENRHALIEEHLENIKSQSLPVEPIYVFEAGDQPSSAAKPYSIVSPCRLSIYQAWHTAMGHSNKKLLINLNLDDRLCPDAVARMSSYFDSDDVMLVGGEWVIANQVAKSDQLRNISIEETYFDPTWPPKTRSFTRPGENLRLGSGMGERGTYGPATMFRRSLIEELPYPLKFGNGELVESIADSLWWSLIKRKYPGGAIRIPEIVGIYHSDPSSQAEFRVTNEWEKLQKWGLM